MSSGIYNKLTGYHNRRSIRMKGYDYLGSGFYFVTICAHRKVCLFGEINSKKMILNKYGQIVDQCWNDLINHYSNIELDEWTIMPNHVHGIIRICDNKPVDLHAVGLPVGTGSFVGAGLTVVGAGLKPAPTGNDKFHGLSEFIRALKTFSARRINKHRNSPGIPVWQRNYFEHIIRDENELYRIRQYIKNNPKNWETDEDYIEQ